ncbi:MAG TPA: RIP metalloprotease RseP [Terracidiphilus sp.]
MIFHRLLAAIAAINLLDLLITLAAFIVLIGIMVVVHEFGHFAVAKLCKVRVEAFSFGFGPRLFGYKYGDTDYKVCALPLGGYVKMSGEQFSELSDAAAGTATIAQVDDPGALTSHPRWQQMLIGVAGPVANFILAFGLMAFYYNFINEVPAVEIKDTAVEWVVPSSAAAQAGIQPGDIIRRFADAENPSWQIIFSMLALDPNQTVPVIVDRNGQLLQLSFHVPAKLAEGDLAGMLPQYTAGPIGVVKVQPGTPADQAGLRPGDGIQLVDGHPFHTVTSLLAYMQDGQGKPLTLLVVRNGAALSPILVRPIQLDSNWRLGFVPKPPAYRSDPLPLGASLNKSKLFCVDNSTLLLEMLKRIATRKVAASSALAGPLGIARAAGDAAESKGWDYKFNLAGEISLNLGIVNLLPFPILDGGMILFLLIESVIRREINIAVKERIYQAAFFLIIALFAFLIFNDFAKLPLVEHLLNQ